MSEETTSGAAGWRVPLPAIWREWGRFVRRPVLPLERMPFGARAVGEVAALLALDVAFALPLAVVLTTLAKSLGLKTPEFEALTSRGALFTIVVGAFVLPLFEELLFRGWLDGRRRHLALVGVLIGAAGSILAAWWLAGNIAATIGVAAAWVVIGAVVAWRVDRSVPGWFVRSFPALFFASALLFGLAHMSNYDLARPWLLLPFVLPQLIAGLILGFARVRYGLWADVALHATGNLLFLGLALAGY